MDIADYLLAEAIRLKRTGWIDRTDLLAQEMYTILSSIPRQARPGPIILDLGSGNPPLPIRQDAFQDPWGGFRIPDLNLPALATSPSLLPAPPPDRTLTGLEPPQIPPLPPWPAVNPPNVTIEVTVLTPPTDQPGVPVQESRVRSETLYFREMMPGKVVSGSGDTYVVQVYPFGEDDTANSYNVTCKQLQIDSNEKVPADTWQLVWCFREVLLVTRIVVELLGGTQGEREVSRETAMTVVKTKYRMQVPVWL